MFDSLQQDYTKRDAQYELNSFVTMATYWVPGLPNIKGISGHFRHSILIFANGASLNMIQQAYKYVSSSLWPWFNVLHTENH